MNTGLSHSAFRRLCLAATLVGAAACTDFPQVDNAVSASARAANYPALVPNDTLLARRDQGRLTEADGEILLARAANLRARARILRRIAEVNDTARERWSDRLRRLGG